MSIYVHLMYCITNCGGMERVSGTVLCTFMRLDQIMRSDIPKKLTSFFILCVLWKHHFVTTKILSTEKAKGLKTTSLVINKDQKNGSVNQFRKNKTCLTSAWTLRGKAHNLSCLTFMFPRRSHVTLGSERKIPRLDKKLSV